MREAGGRQWAGSSATKKETALLRTYPLTDAEDIREDTLASIPPLSDVVEAKEWVDDNQK